VPAAMKRTADPPLAPIAQRTFDTIGDVLLRGGYMANPKGPASILSELRQELAIQVDRRKHLDAALSVLGKLRDRSYSVKSGHTISAAGRRKISLAQKARWAKVRAAKK
jgi:hypothetical protein